MDRVLLDITIPAEPEQSAQLRSSLNGMLSACSIDSTLKGNITLCLAEAVNNLIAYNDNVRNIRLRFGRNSRCYWLTLQDNGTFWDPTAHPTPPLAKIALDSEHGRGIALIKSLTDQVNYYQRSLKPNAKNILRMQWVIPERLALPTLLIIDDDESAIRLYNSYLEDQYNVISVLNAKDAITHLEENTVEIILSDIRMPDMDGFAFREHIDKSSANTAPFIFLSAADDNVTKHRANSLGIDDFLLKPIGKEQLTLSIERVLQRSNQISSLLSTRLNRKISDLLQPQLPEKIHGWNLRVSHRNTGYGGGDLVFFHQTDTDIHITLIDIMGHDEAAKFFAYAYGGYVRGLMQSYTPPLRPNQLLEKLSAVALEDDLLSKVILTCCALTLDKDNTVTIASAGHPAPLMIQESKVQELDVGGELPGLSACSKYENKTFQLTMGTRLALYTDGLFESAPDNSARLYLEEQVTQRLHSTLNAPIDDAMRTTMKVFDRLAGSPPSDDTLLILVEHAHSLHDA